MYIKVLLQAFRNNEL